MYNHFIIETEAEARRHEFALMAAADARTAGAIQLSLMRRWLARMSRPAADGAARSLPSTPVGALLEMRRVPRPVAC